MRVAYLGTSEFAAGVLERLPEPPVLVVTRPDRPSGRGKKLTPPPVAVRAGELGLPLIQPERLHEPAVVERIEEAIPDVLVVCAYGVLIKEPLLTLKPILNVHPSLLPRWRGAAPIERAILAGDQETGVAIMHLTAGLDSGPVYALEREPIGPRDDFASLSARLLERGARLLAEVLGHEPLPVPAEQPEEGVTYAEKIEAADRLLDPAAEDAAALDRRVRALHPHIGARIELGGELVRVTRARPGDHGPLTVPAANATTLTLLELQPPGGRPMDAEAFLRGRPHLR